MPLAACHNIIIIIINDHPCIKHWRLMNDNSCCIYRKAEYWPMDRICAWRPVMAFESDTNLFIYPGYRWRVVDAKHMRMSGYSARVRSFAWTAGGKWLATSGSEQLVLWPFQGKDGPMGKQPKMFAAFAVRVTAIACHPKQEVVAVGYASHVNEDSVYYGRGGQNLQGQPADDYPLF